MTQCPACQNENLSPSGDGRLVCADCGEQFDGFQEEEVDFVLKGTFMTSRNSQASQAMSQRKRIEAYKQTAEADMLAKKHVVPDELLISEGVFILSKAIAKRLIKLKYVPERIMHPLFEIITYWVRQLHSSVDCSSLFNQFQPYMALSIICLAAVCVRSTMLPRDLCRLVNTQQVPFFAALKTIFPDTFTKTPAVRTAFTAQSFPVPRAVIRCASLIARDKDAWPPLMQFFRSNGHRQKDGVPLDGYSDLLDDLKKPNPTAFPLGHMQITLLRLTRLFNLPDDFGARVLRFIELRRTAVKMARVLNGLNDGPWDESKIDSHKVSNIPHYRVSGELFSQPLPNEHDLYAFPTDESLQIDIINTMRLCYGRTKERVHPRHPKNPPSELDTKMREEWGHCKKAMMKWLKYGNAEDIDNVCWTSLTPKTLASLTGKDLIDYARLTDDIMAGRGEKNPELWGTFLRAFKNIGEGCIEVDDMQTGDDDQEYVRTEKTCMYDLSRCPDAPLFEPDEGMEAMDEDIVPLDEEDKGKGGFEWGRRILRKRTDKEKFHGPPHPNAHRPPRRILEFDLWHEPVGIGLAWTIMLRFFEGTSLEVSGTEINSSLKEQWNRMQVACDRMMLVVLKYILGLLQLKKRQEFNAQNGQQQAMKEARKEIMTETAKETKKTILDAFKKEAIRSAVKLAYIDKVNAVARKHAT